MNEIQYIGEHLWPGRLGQWAIFLAFSSGLFAALSYFFATNRRALPEAATWRRMGRWGFALHGLSVFAVMGLLFYLLVNHYYEYHYVWSHVSDELPFRYIFSAFWEGQEGSFLLWMFWHVVLGGVLLWRAGRWEAPVLAVLSLVQVFLLTMILGVYLGGDFRIGSSPFVLLRDVMDIPLFNNAEYVSLIQGNGLNPLLQNYWMTIHPPTLFLGFASTVVPYAYAVAALWLNEPKSWLRPVLPWALFSGAILGTGILMGGAWAYEALSFGGYWAWDPVENSSLVPWLLLIAGIHANLIARHTGYSIKSTLWLYLLTFVFINYSTFLTRSGVLGDTSVHAFTEMGLESQLLLYLFAFLLLPIGLMVWRNKAIPAPRKEESIASREFWMFIGALVLLFSAGMITASTSLPVYNKIVQLFDPAYEGLTITEPIEHYNKYQLWIAVFIGLLSGAAQFLRYRDQTPSARLRKAAKHWGIGVAGGALLSFLVSLWIEIGTLPFYILLFSGCFAIVSNLDYLFSQLRGNLKLSGSVLAHTGFGLMIVGVLASGLNKQHISTNPFAQRGLLDEEMLERNVLLFKGIPMFMSGYRVTYERDTMVGNERTFQVRFEKMSPEGDIVESFTLHPTALYDNKITKVAAFNPDTKHYLDKDIFTHIATLPAREADFQLAREMEDSLDYRLYPLQLGRTLTLRDTINARDTFSVLETQVRLLGMLRHPTHPDYQPQPGDLRLGLRLAFHKADEDTTFLAEPMLVLRGQMLYTYPVQLNELSMKVRLGEEALGALFTPEEELAYRKFVLKQGDSFTLNGLNITFAGFEKDPRHPAYEAQEGDIAVGARFDLEYAGQRFSALPVYLIRGTRPFNLKDELPELGLHFRFTGIDPQSETIEVLVAQRPGGLPQIPVEIAKKSFRTDYIVLEAILFPGINLFWLGTCLMMLGLLVSFLHRRLRQPDAISADGRAESRAAGSPSPELPTEVQQEA